MPRGRTWVVGAAGMLGRTLCEELAARGLPTLSSGRETSIAEGAELWDFARRAHAAAPISAVVNCAAFTQVDACEQAWPEAWAVNGRGAGHLGEVARRLGAAAVHISSDYVFDPAAAEGAAAPLVEADACQPRSAYGRSKWLGEALFSAAVAAPPQPTWGAVVRTSWLFGEHGGNFVETMLSLMAQRPALRVVADQVGRPTYARDLAGAVLDLLGLGQRPRAPAGTYHFANAGPTSWHGFAAGIYRAAREAGLKLAIADLSALQPVASADYPQLAPRPAYSVLDTTRVQQVLGRAPRAWTVALAAHLRRRLQPAPSASASASAQAQAQAQAPA